jgi:hypothetical protein
MKVYLKTCYIKTGYIPSSLGFGSELEQKQEIIIREVDESEIKPGHAKLIGHWREPSFRNLCIVLLGENYTKKILELTCRCGGKIKSIQDMHDHWQRGHFDVPIYEEINRGNYV